MKKYLITFLILVFIFFACKERKQYIPVTQLKEILLQMHMAESYALLTPKDSNLQYTDTTLLAMHYNNILNQHHITQQQFENSIQYYKDIPGMYDSIYQMILNDISILQSKIQLEQSQKDSAITL